MAWIESPYKKKRRRYYKSQKAKLQAINAKYTQIFQQMGVLKGDFLSYEEIHSPAWRYAEQRAAANLTWYQAIISGNGAQMIFSFIMLVVSIVLCFTPAAPAGAAGIGAVVANATTMVVSKVMEIITMISNILSALASFASSVLNQHYSFKVAGEAGLLENKGEALSAYKRREQAEQQSNALTALMIYGGYSIYANGEVFNQHSAGSQTFSNSIAYDSTKGIRGDVKKNPLDEQIHSRTGADLAGGTNFHANLMQLPFPLAQFSFGSMQIQDSLINRYLLIIRTINNAFVELNNKDFNADKNAQNTYNNVVERLTKQTKTALYQDDFLNKMKNYNRNLRADFDYKNDKFFKKEEKNSTDFRGALSTDGFDEMMNNKDIDNDTKANYYIDMILMLFDFLEFWASDMSAFAYIYSYNDEWYGSGGEGGNTGLFEKRTMISPIQTEPFEVLKIQTKTSSWEDKYKKTYKNATHISNELGGSLYVVPEMIETNKYYDENKPVKRTIAPFEEFSNFHYSHLLQNIALKVKFYSKISQNSAVSPVTLKSTPL